MVSGTPCLTTHLPTIPEDHYPYVYFIENESIEGIAAALKETLAKGSKELLEKGKAARNFVLVEKNNVVQARKIIQLLQEI